MDIKSALLVFTLLAGCFALPTLPGQEEDLSVYFEHNDAGSRIVGGTESAIGSHPHMVALTAGISIRSLLCGASLISHRTVLSAAHCLDYVDNPVRTLFAIVGTNRWNFGGTTYSFSGVVIHPDYKPYEYQNDICLFTTANNVVFNNLVRPVALSFSYVPGGVSAKIAGWGRIRFGGEGSRTLLELTTTTLDIHDCAARWANLAPALNIPPVNTENEICTLHSVGHGFCHGDSGSALTRADNGQQIGIVSWMNPCARGFPDVYVRISAHRAWIQANAL